MDSCECAAQERGWPVTIMQLNFDISISGGGPLYKGILLIMLRGMHKKHAVGYNIEFRYKVSICCNTERKQGKPYWVSPSRISAIQNVKVQFVLHKNILCYITRHIRLMLFMEIIAVYYKNHAKHINTLFGQNAESVKVKACGKYSNHCVLKGQQKVRTRS